MTSTLITQHRPWLFRFSVFLTFSTLLLLLAGGLVTSHEAGLAVPDWPLSYGQFFPPMVGNIFWEHGHRMIAGTVGIFTLILAASLQIFETRPWLKKLGWIALGMVILQALLGGLTVIYLLPPPVSIAHACLGQTFFCVLVAITYALYPREPLGFNPRGSRGLARILVLTFAFLYLQLILGAAVRHTAHPLAIAAHVIMAFVVVIFVLALCYRIGGRLSIFLSLLTLTQFFLGFGSFVTTRMMERSYSPSSTEVIFTATHQTTGALILGLTLLLILKSSKVGNVD